MPAAARATNKHRCPRHGEGELTVGERTVLIGSQPAVRVGDTFACGRARDAIKQGESTVLIGYKPAARQGDRTDHGGQVTEGDPTVLIGMSAQADTLRGSNKPFCEDCATKRDKRRSKVRTQAE